MIPLSAALLAGGRSERMGRDKCLIEIDGVPLWRRQYQLLRKLTPDVVISAPARPQWCPEDVPWIPDATPDAGPLGGLAAVLATATHPRVLVLAVDLPDMTAEFLERLSALSTDERGIAPVIDDLFQPLSAIYPRAASITARQHLAEPDKSLQRLIRHLVKAGRMTTLPVNTPDLPRFRNRNTVND
jgi:molybdopterin-guanine dinucleotide biosynthesis protein A